MDRKKQSFIGLTAKLEAMSPLKVLTRGYAMAQTEDGKTLRSVHDAKDGEKIRVLVADGSIYAEVTGREENENVRK